jgi:hypothetical protein
MKIKRLLIACAALAATSLITAASFFGPPSPIAAVDSTQGGIANMTQPTNGLYTAAIQGGNSTVWETNLVPLTFAAAGNELLLNIQAQASSASFCTNMYVLISTAPKGRVRSSDITNSATLGQAGSSKQRSTYWWTNTIALNGTTMVSTNILLSPFTTNPAYANDMDVFVEQIGYLGTNGTYITNFSVTPVGIQ